MSTEADRQLVEALAERAALGDRNKMQPMMGIVTEHGTGDFTGMVRVRRTPHEPPGSPARPFYYVFGDLPAVDAEVFTLSNFATGVVMGATTGSGYETVAEGGTPVAQQPQLNFGSGFDVANNAGASRTDVTLDASEKLATSGVDGFMPGTDKTKLDGLPGPSYKTMQEEGSSRTQRDNLNFGTAFNVADNPGSSRTDVSLDWWRREAVGLFRVHLGAQQNNIPNITETKINYNSEAWDINGWYDTSTVRYTPQIAGYYQFIAGARMLPGVANNYVRLYLRASGVTVFRLGQSTAIDTADVDCGGASPPVFANGTTDYFEVYLWHDFGVGTSDIIASTIETYFGGYFLGV